MYKLDLEKGAEPEIELPTSFGSQKKQQNSRKTSTSASLTMLKSLCRSQQTVENSLRDGNTRPPYLPPEKSNNENQIWNNRLVQNWERSMSKLYIVTCLFNLHAEYIMQNAGLDEAQAGIKIAWRNINILRYADGTTLMAESKEELKSLLMNIKEESEKVGLKLSIKKTKIMASGPGTSWQRDVQKSDRFYFLGLQNHCTVTTAMKLKDTYSLEEKL